jgi:hypothetical protein
MGIWHFVWVVIPLAAIGAGVAKHWFALQERRLDRMSHETVERAAQYAAKTERLEQRVAVLERILTDRSEHLSDEIERLRDRPVN